jgi:preprotein translocase subunit SecF
MSKRAKRRGSASKTRASMPAETKKPKRKVSSLESFFEKNYKLFLIVPLVLLIFVIAQISFQVATTGEFINKGVSLKGGTSITIEKTFDDAGLLDAIQAAMPDHDASLRELTNRGEIVAVIVESTVTEETDRATLISLIEQFSGEMTEDEFTVEVIGSSLGASFFKDTFKALILAFVLMGIVVFIYFRTFVPSLAVILSAFLDISVTAAIVNMLGFKLSTAGIAAFLMLIGYSVDTDILLATKMVKGTGAAFDRIKEAFKTGIVMTITTIGAISVALLLTQSDVIRQIMTIVLIGLVVDLVTTWIQNTAILRWYLESQKTKKSRGAKK